MSTSKFTILSLSNVVLDVIEAQQDVIDDRAARGIDAAVHGQEVTYERTWFSPNGDPAKRFNYAGKGYLFDPAAGTMGAYIAPKPFASWVLDESKYQWIPPIPYPEDYDELPYIWDEAQYQIDGAGWRIRT